MGESSNNVDDGSDKLSPHQEETLLEEMLRHQMGLDPQRLGGVLDLAAVGIVNEAWRNGPIEDCHSSGGGLMIDAPDFGHVVKSEPYAGSDLLGATRPGLL